MSCRYINVSANFMGIRR